MKSLILIITATFGFSATALADHTYSFVTNFGLESVTMVGDLPVPLPLPIPSPEDPMPTPIDPIPMPGDPSDGSDSHPGQDLQSLALIQLSHARPFGNAQFKFVPGQACREIYPRHCHGTIVRLDDSAEDPSSVVSNRMEVNLSRYFGPSPVVVTIHGPDRNFTVQY